MSRDAINFNSNNNNNNSRSSKRTRKRKQKKREKKIRNDIRSTNREREREEGGAIKAFRFYNRRCSFVFRSCTQEQSRTMRLRLLGHGSAILFGNLSQLMTFILFFLTFVIKVCVCVCVGGGVI